MVPHTPVQRSFRLPSETIGALDRRAREHGQSANAVAARLIDGGLRGEAHPLNLLPRRGPRPALIGSRVDAWQAIDTLRAHDGAIDATSEYLEQPEVKIRAALRYYADFTAEVDALERPVWTGVVGSLEVVSEHEGGGVRCAARWVGAGPGDGSRRRDAARDRGAAA
jgi:hypothetical protein